MRTFKYEFQHQSNVIRIGNLLDDMWQAHLYFHKWQRQRHKDSLPYANYNAMDAHFKVLKRTTHPHWNMLPSQAVQQELMRIDKAYQQFFDKIGGRPKIKKRHKFKSIGGVLSVNSRHSIAKSLTNALIGSGNLRLTCAAGLMLS